MKRSELVELIDDFPYYGGEKIVKYLEYLRVLRTFDVEQPEEYNDEGR